MDGEKILDISGHTCKRGEKYARTEVIDPRRTLTTTMRVREGKSPLVAVKSERPLPKGLLFGCMGEINKTAVRAPVRIGDTVIKDILGTGIDIVATERVSGV
jgi:CxxC motif-containing protein